MQCVVSCDCTWYAVEQRLGGSDVRWSTLLPPTAMVSFRIAAMEQIEARRDFTHAVAAHYVSHTGLVAKSTTKT